MRTAKLQISLPDAEHTMLRPLSYFMPPLVKIVIIINELTFRLRWHKLQLLHDFHRCLVLFSLCLLFLALFFKESPLLLGTLTLISCFLLTAGDLFRIQNLVAVVKHLVTELLALSPCF